MGGSVSHLWSSLWPKKEHQILMYGLVCSMSFAPRDGILADAGADHDALFDQFNSGKTTILYTQLKAS